MKTLAALIREYKKTMSEDDKEKIFDFILDDDNISLFEDIFVYKNHTEWVDYGDGLKVKRIEHGRYLATEVFDSGVGYICYAYKIDLSEYSPRALEEYRRNCVQYSKVSPDDEFFAAASVAAAFTVENSETMCIVSSLVELDSWFVKIEKEFLK